MAGNSFGTLFRVTTFGESHGPMIGMVIDGCPAGLKIDHNFLKLQMSRRRPGQSKITTQRNEADEFTIISGVYEGITTGTPIAAFILNEDTRGKDYDQLATAYRPSHADFTYDQKYGHRDHRGGGRSSARETAARVLAGGIAQLLLSKFKIKIYAYVSQVGKLALDPGTHSVDFKKIEQNLVRCPNMELASEMQRQIEEARKNGDTLGGVVTGVIKGCPAGLGEPVFDRLSADLGKAMLSINATKGFEYGSGFEGVGKKGSEHNDVFFKKNGKVITKTNFSGGIQGGISNGMNIEFRVAFKPVATIMQDQRSLNKKGQSVVLKGKGRHDPCVVPRAVPIVEAMAALTMADHLLRNRSSKI